MSTSKHTPAPWRWLNNSTLMGDHGHRPMVLAGKDLRQRDGRGLLVPLDAGSPDARLIAAAPELLAALKELLRISTTDEWGLGGGSLDDALATARSITERAEGLR